MKVFEAMFANRDKLENLAIFGPWGPHFWTDKKWRKD